MPPQPPPPPPPPQFPVDLGAILTDVRASVEGALKTIPFGVQMWPSGGPPGCPRSPGAAWGGPWTPGSSSAASSSTGRPTIPAFPKDDEIVVDVWTHAVKDTYNLKKSVSVKTVSGAIKATIVPSPTPSSELIRKLHTQTNTGSQHITVATSLGPFLMDSSHSTMTGSIKLVYPEDWSGTVEISLTHGSYKVNSSLNDAVVVRDVVDSTHERKILVLKGNPREGEEWSTMKINSKTGSVDVRFEKMPALRDMTQEEVRAEEEERRRSMPTPTSPGERGNGGGGNKEQKERMGPAVTRSAAYSETQQQPAYDGQQQQARVNEDLPPSYEQSEEENVRNQTVRD